jgi:transcriptional regulator with XRE-family HTH domain
MPLDCAEAHVSEPYVSKSWKGKKREDADISVKLGMKIRERRKQLKMSMQVAGACVGVSYQQWQKWEIGTNMVSVPRLISIADALKTPVAYFLEDHIDEAAAVNLRRQEDRARIDAVNAARQALDLLTRAIGALK